ncbi:cholesterol oxidase [Gordonia jinghuaiqii]|uniref:Cholesterol oxidase n=1 Tax=Gordonia jinghuaiqii TaxID=2758710 RepID=A0A7D7R0G4_9ACTN|nr:GMC oxidoreductase [Gordonia jinghuaiqii]MCR5976445.1 cholesterol oxidase [Gordonia jinghuaiqii]QMS99651.1 GMC family oxidoreductase [Gordonia jinghuaiqii]
MNLDTSGPVVPRRTVIRSAAGAVALAALAATATPGRAAPGRTAIVIGTGFGGSVAALRLGEAGYTTTVFERGRRWPIRPDGNTFATFSNPDKRAAWFGSRAGANNATAIPVEPYPGVLDHVVGNGIEAVYGAGVGGGSLVFGSFTPVPRRRDFEHVFPAAADYSELMATYYPRAKRTLGVSPLPNDILSHPNYVGARSWLKVIARYGANPHFFDFAIDWDIVRAEIAGRRSPSVIVGELSYGVNSGAKKSTDRTYLAAAERTGNVTIAPMHEVFDIRPRARRAGFVVTARVRDEQGRTIRTVTAEADHLFMAAGSFHTTRMLVEARAKGSLPRLSPRIGDGFGTNGDFLTIRTNPSDDFGSVQGGPGYARIYDDHLSDTPMSMVYQATPLPAPLGKAGTTHLVQTHTDERGTVDFDHTTRTARLTYPYPEGSNDVDRQAASFISRFHQRTEVRYGRPANGVPVYPRAVGFGSASTYHGLGGVVMGQAATMNGAVRGYDNLYVVDGSFVPGAVGLVNPALTITALAERTMDRFLATH